LKSRDEIGEAFCKSGRQVQRYIQLTELIYQLLGKVDEDIIKLITGTEISYARRIGIILAIYSN